MSNEISANTIIIYQRNLRKHLSKTSKYMSKRFWQHDERNLEKYLHSLSARISKEYLDIMSKTISTVASQKDLVRYLMTSKHHCITSNMQWLIVEPDLDQFHIYTISNSLHLTIISHVIIMHVPADRSNSCTIIKLCG